MSKCRCMITYGNGVPAVTPYREYPLQYREYREYPIQYREYREYPLQSRHTVSTHCSTVSTVCVLYLPSLTRVAQGAA